LLVAPATSSGDAPPPTIVLPLRSLGVNDTTLAVSRDLLESSLEQLGVSVMRLPAAFEVSDGGTVCDAPDCAREIGARLGAGQVIYGSLSKLGDKIIARIYGIRVDAGTPHYRDQLASTSESDLDAVMHRFAEGIAAGRSSSDGATIDSVTEQETREPARRASRRGFGVRAGFLFPSGNSYAHADRLAGLRIPLRFETHDFSIESTTLLGLAWGDSQVDWTIFDLSASRIFGTGDVSTFLGAGIGLHVVRLERAEVIRSLGYEYEETTSQDATVPTLDLVAGILALRTYDFELVGEIRYHHSFEDFERIGGHGAHGLQVSFGTSR
jgi:hypothetical protein